MVTYLEELFSQPDVRTHIDGTFKLQEFTIKYAKRQNKNAPDRKAIEKEAQESLFIKSAGDEE